MTRHVLKNNEVQFGGSFHLDVNAGAADKTVECRPNPTTPNVRIVKTGCEFALVEVACSCGQVTLVRCEYATDDSQAPVGSAQG